MESAIKMSSTLEFSGFSYSTPARVTFENVTVSKKEKKKGKKKTQIIKSFQTENLKGKENSSLRRNQNL